MNTHEVEQREDDAMTAELIEPYVDAEFAPIRNLAHAVILRAIRDMGLRVLKAPGAMPDESPTVIKRNARKFIEDTGDDLWSFNWWADCGNVDASYIRKNLTAIIELLNSCEDDRSLKSLLRLSHRRVR